LSRKRTTRIGYGEEPISFVGIERDTIIRNPEWRTLNAPAKIFYIHLKARFNGSNNGKIRLPYSTMVGVKGCSSKTSCAKAIKELEQKEWIKVKKRGGMYRHDNFYKLTFKHEGFEGEKG